MTSSKQQEESFFKLEELVPITRKEHWKKSGIYLILNMIKGRIYVGSAINLYNRKSVHLSDLNQNCHHSAFLQRDYNKIKEREEVFQFFVYKLVEKKEQLLIEEQKVLDKIYGKKNCYNMAAIAGSGLGLKHTEETKKILSLQHLGKKHSQATKDKMSKTRTGVPLSDNHPIKLYGHTEEAKRKIHNSLLGEKNPFYGRKHTKETKEKIRQKITGNYYGPTCQVKAVNNKTGETKIFISMSEAARNLHIPDNVISLLCSGKQKTSKFGWSFEKVK